MRIPVYTRRGTSKWRTAILKKIKAGRTCARCGENDQDCLDWHHIDPKTKKQRVYRFAADGYSIDRIMKEIDKCIVLCSNCHRKEHSRMKRRDNMGTDGRSSEKAKEAARARMKALWANPETRKRMGRGVKKGETRTTESESNQTAGGGG